MPRTIHRIALFLFAAIAATVARGEETASKEGLHSVGLTTLGATAKGSGAPWNKDWPAINTLLPGHGRPLGALFGHPMTGAELDIRLVIPLDIKGVELFPLKYRGTRQISEAEIYVDGELVDTVQIPHAPGQGHFYPLDAEGQHVMVKVTGEHPLEDLGDGKKGAPWGGWNRIRVYSSTDLEALMAIPSDYQAEVNPNFIAPTGGTIAAGIPEVTGEPRVTTGHPRTIWDQEDIDHYKAMLETSAELRTQLEGLKAAMDERMTMPIGVPEPRQDDEGNWVHISDVEVGATHNALSLDLANLGTVYVLTGEEKYADFAKQILLAYADAYPKYGVGARPGFNHDPSRVFDQRLGDAIWLIQVARGYDLIYNSPMTDEERETIEEVFLKPAAHFITKNRHVMNSATNWSAIATTAVFITGVATDDQELIDWGLYGLNHDKDPSPWWEGQPNKNPSGMELQFSEKAISEDGLWTEGAMGYQFMAMQALITDAEILWHMGIDLYSYRDGALKRLFDSPLEYSYPDLKTPAINDSGHGSIVGREAYLYEFGYRRYQDPKYLTILKQTGHRLGASFQQFPVSILYDIDLEAATQPVEWESVNFFEVGYGILRNTTPRGTVSLLMDYGQSGSHDHPDKLNIDIWGFGDRLLPDPGSVWYEDPMYHNWYRPTVSHNTLVVDELSQAMGSRVDPDQLVYAPAERMGLQRARVGTAYSGVMMDRAVFVTPEYTADLFGAFAGLPRTMDLAWHPVGELGATSLDLAEYTFPEPRRPGYSRLEDTRAATTAGGYSIDVANESTPLRLVAAGGEETEVIVGKGHLGMKNPPAILQRRVTNASVWANAFDYSGDSFVDAVQVAGSLEDGFALATIQTKDGTDHAFAAYAPGTHEPDGLTTDAQQAFVKRRDGRIDGIFLGGGTLLRTEEGAIERGSPGLAFAEHAATGAYVVGNPSPGEGTITLTLPGIESMEAYLLDRDGKRTGPADVARADGAVTVTLAPVSRMELAKPGATSVYEHHQEMLRQRLAEQEAALKAEREAIMNRAEARLADAANYEVPEGTVVVVQAEDMAGQGGDEVSISSNKRNTVGKAFSGWNNVGHWIEYNVEAPAEGYYNLAFVYCSAMENGERVVEVNGEPVDPDLSVTFPSTGGWANNSDDWRLLTFGNPEAGRPVLIKLREGTNTVRFTNTNGRGVNLDYFAFVSPDVEPTRPMLEEEAD